MWWLGGERLTDEQGQESSAIIPLQQLKYSYRDSSTDNSGIGKMTMEMEDTGLLRAYTEEEVSYKQEDI